ncbi:MAG: surface lipoprotein assembly modifier [Steroidobacteraceae bacterium]
MSSLCRNAESASRAVAAACLLAGTVSLPALAADTYFQPMANVRVDHESNRRLVPDGLPSKSVTGYTASAGAVFGARTPRSETDVRPEISFSRYPDEKEFNQTEARLDFRTRYRSERSTLGLMAKYSRMSEYNAEFGDAAFDEFDPDAPPVTGDGTVLASERRTRVDLRPSFEYRLSPLTRIGLDLLAQDVSYSADGATSQVDHRNYDVDLRLARQLSPRTTVLAGVFATRYETEDDVNVTDGYGASLGLQQRWSETFTADVNFRIEDSNIEVRTTEIGGPVTLKESKTPWTLQGALAWRGQVTRVRVMAGHMLAPSGSGSRNERDEIRAQVDRDLSERLIWRGIVRAFHEKREGELGQRNERDSARLETSLDWRAAPTWFVRVGAAYTWQDRKTDPASADSASVYVSIGYQGLGPARR